MEVDGSRDDAATRAFFDQWTIYRTIVRGDYMHHRGIHAAMRSSLMARDAPFSVLDLGCGDARSVAATLDGQPIRAYTGVDLSDIALAEARRSLADAPFDVTLEATDFLAFLRGRRQPVDVIIAGFSVHHLCGEEKEEFFARCAEWLTEGGDLYLYDVALRPGETRAAYVTAYLSACDRGWTLLTPSQREATKEHVRTRDIPETPATLARMAADAGLAGDGEPLYRDSAGFHVLLRFRA
jgi:SAM-dependent methyltransferase